MSPSTHTVLVEIVDTAQESGEPVTIRELADSLEVPESTVSDRIDSLREFELVARTQQGYRPTVTAHDLLQKDPDFEDLLVVDLVEE